MTDSNVDDSGGSKEMAPLLSAPNTADEKSVSDSSGDEQVTDNGHDSGFIHEAVQHTGKHYSLWVAVVFILNYSIGAGVLGLPNEYYKTGYILGTIILAWNSILTYMAYKHVGNLVFRAEAVTACAIGFGLNKSDFLDKPDYIISQLRDNVNINDFRIKYDRFHKNEYELNHLIGMFCGRRWRIAYDIMFFLTQTIGLWSYCALFGASLARLQGISGISSSCNIEQGDSDDNDCRLLYTLYVCCFWIWCIILVLMDFTEQMGLQVASFMARLLILTLMFITTIGLMYGNLEYSDHSDKYTKRSNENTPYYGDNVTAWDWSGLLYFIAVGSFAFSNQFCIPDVIEPLRREDRTKMTKMVASNIVILFVMYSCIGITVSLYFGDTVEDPCTLAWKYFRGFNWNDGDRPDWSYVITYFVLLLPPIDLASAYPLNAITVANTLEQSLLNLERLREDPNYFTKWKVLIRVVLVSITAILALLVWDFEFIITLSGVCGLIALYMIPAYAEYRSQQMCQIITNDNTAYETPVTDFSSNIIGIYAIVITSCIGVIGVIVELSTD